eukprot:4445652-Amphidinium_carterae.1
MVMRLVRTCSNMKREMGLLHIAAFIIAYGSSAFLRHGLFGAELSGNGVEGSVWSTSPQPCTDKWS